jgi:zinc transport system substrate-binding protein
VLAGCGQDLASKLDQAANNGGGKPLVFTVNYPLAWMAEQLAGDTATVVLPAPAGVDPAYWQPDIATLLRYQQADLVLLNGAGYAKWLAGASLPASRLVDTSLAYRDQLLVVDSAPVHSHGPQGDHSHGDLAFTTWLDLQLAQQQASVVARALQRLLPEESAAIDLRLATLQKVLADLDARLLALGARLDGVPLLYSHPVYQYLQRRYRLTGEALHWEPDQIPDDTQWLELANILQDHPAQSMLWEGQPLPAVAARLAQLGIDVVVFAPLANRPKQGDFSANMEANVQALEAALN